MSPEPRWRQIFDRFLRISGGVFLVVFGGLFILTLFAPVPSFKFWLTRTALFPAIAFLFASGVSVMGLTQLSRWQFWSLMSVALVLSGGAWWQAAEQSSASAQQIRDAAIQKAENKKLMDHITDGDNYAYFTVEKNVAPNGENYLLVTTTGQMPSFDCSVRRVASGGQVSDWREWAIRSLPKMTSRFAFTTLPPGRYQLSCVMGEKIWQQHLEFRRTPEGIYQTSLVEKDNRVVRKEP